MTEDKIECEFNYYNELDGIGDDVIALMELKIFLTMLDTNDQFADLPSEYIMLVIVFLGLLAVALSSPDNYVARMFQYLDDNKDEAIGFSELFANYHNDDVDGDELMTLEEFAAGPHPGSPPLEVGKAFKIFDKMDGQEDGFIRPSSAEAVFKRLDGNSNMVPLTAVTTPSHTNSSNKSCFTDLHLIQSNSFMFIIKPQGVRYISTARDTTSCSQGNLQLLRQDGRDDNQSDRKSFNGLDENRDGFIQLPELLSRFDEIDTNNDGNVTLDEGLASKPREMSLKEFLAYFDFYDKQDGAADQMVSKIAVLLSFVTMDANNDHQLTLEEFGADLTPGSPPLDVESAFKFFDTKDLEENGLLDKSAVLFYFNGLDSNNDGNITIEEDTATQVPGTPEIVIQGNFNYYDKLDGAADGVISLSVAPVLFDILDADAEYDGIISIEEIAATQLPGTPEIVIQGTFNYYDKLDGAADGVISLSVAPVLFHIFDANGDGEITLDEWFITLPQVNDGIQNEIMALYAA
ncbi:hypothetical protein C0Q70_13020 [Pomacea canaliculata]|uniref:EF-hand domain-containing protein n=1 Tax=Pomacea canaliculata TaxID=400727 RepID=A0A2T7P336_POMCA|nr:hypothetical protein C0Q70_13020 [Pomacea canaliculata]